MSQAFSTCDLCDVHKSDTSGNFRVLPPIFTDFGGRARFSGRVRTVQCLDDNSQVKALLNTPGDGQVLVVDGGGSLRRSLVGGLIAASAAKQGWAGVLVFGAVRDKAELAACEVGVKAMALMPLPTDRKEQGLVDVVVHIAGVRIAPGDWLYADEDGVVVLAQAAT